MHPDDGSTTPESSAIAHLPTGRSSFGLLGRRVLPLVAIFVTAGTLFLPGYAHADFSIEKFIALAIAWIAHLLTSFIGELLLLAVGALIWIAQYNGFVDSVAVLNGWTIVRDVANMFFIVILLVIAFGTMLGIQQYHYSKMLPRLLVMAIVVNFSRTICGLIIDFAQVVMLTFVHGFREAAGGNFTQALGLDSLMQMNVDSNSNADLAWQIALSMILALVLVTISLGAVIIMICVLVVRIVYLWLLTVLSPLAFLSKAAPFSQGQSFYGEWWGKFTSQTVVGPFMAFFLWLSLISVAGGSITATGFPSGGDTGEHLISQEASSAFTADNIQKFIISIGLLLGGVSMASKMSQSAVGVGKGISMGAGRAAVRMGKGAARMTGRAAVGAAGAAGGAALYNKAKGGMLAAGTRVPLVRGAAGKALASHRQGMAAKSAEAKSWMGQLTPDERKRYTKSLKPTALMSPEERSVQKEALRASMQDGAAGKIPMSAADFHAQKSRLTKLGSLTSDASVTNDLKAMEKQRPSFIVNPNADAATQKGQIDQFRQVAKSMTADDLSKLQPSEFTPELLANVGANALAKGRDKMSTAQLDAIKDAEGKPVSFNYLSEEGKLDRLTGMSPDDAAKIPAEAVTAAVLAAMSGDQMKSFMGANGGRMQSMNLSAPEIVRDSNLAKKIAESMGADQIRKMPRELADAVRSGLKNDPIKMVKSGASFGQAYSGYSDRAGAFKSLDEKKSFAKQMQRRGNAAEVLKAASPSQIAENGGVNDISMTAITNMEMGDVKDLMKSGGPGQTFAVVQAAQGIAGANPLKEGERYSKMLEGLAGVSDAEKSQMYSDFQNSLEAAQQKAQAILKEIGKGGSLRADVKGMTFTGQGKAAAAAGIGAAAAAIKGAPAAIRKEVQAAQRAISDTAKQNLNAAKATLSEAKSQAAAAKRKLGRGVKRF